MAKISWKPGNMVYPLPAVMVTVRGKDGKDNIITIAWTGTVCTNPPMLYISVRKERYSYHLLKEAGEFVVNLTTDRLVRATDYCGVRSGEKVDKFGETRLTKEEAKKINCAMIGESPVNIECRIRQVIPLGSHDMFLADVVNVNVDDQYMEENGRFDLSLSSPLVYSHGEYYKIGKKIGSFGFSVKKKKRKRKS
ncbi:MAG: flavin reductase family protein [Lachnospiraceae bacterium]|nr:flavin reductase family protein [Lachnospiraceae bacterium]